MSDASLFVDEGIGAGVEEICVTIDIPSGGVVECELSVQLSPDEGTASTYKI